MSDVPIPSPSMMAGKKKPTPPAQQVNKTKAQAKADRESDFLTALSFIMGHHLLSWQKEATLKIMKQHASGLPLKFSVPDGRRYENGGFRSE